MKLIPIPEKTRELIAALGRAGCAQICLTIMSPKDREWKRSSEVYYTVSSQLRMPWATYSKLTKFLSERGFIDFNQAVYKNRKTYFARLTPLGRDFVAMYVGLGGKTLKDLEPDEQTSPLTA
jgi:hypothetical protein